MKDHDLSRYHRQIILPGIGEDGQRKLSTSTAVVIGCGATGSVLANHLARAGIGRLRIVDRDFIELNNLQRQLLFDEDDIVQNLPKAVAAARKLRRTNSEIEIEDVVADVNSGNIEGLIADADIVLDGTDNFTTRYLINDACVKHRKPWVYTGVLATYGMSMTIRPHETACLRCVLGEIPAPGTTPTCDTAGVLGPIVAVMASISASEVLKLLTGLGQLNDGMIHVDLLDNEFERFDVGGPRPDCPTCGEGRYEFLNAEMGTRTVTLCGRNAVQITVIGIGRIDLQQLAKRLEEHGKVRVNQYLLRARIDSYEFTIFPDARAIIKGTTDEKEARTLYAR
ncbi:MAG TPA: thiazole biosynthesis adenylyltransferase ThiF, partial [Anaerolineae bacterium]|nr:thiazole biosynthesis adenylyltransferase ThiF [Anaerolineae bacterium]